jgi:hypothetical protein
VIVRLLTALSGPTISAAAGDLYECDPQAAARLIAAGFAVPVERQEEPETAVRVVTKRTAAKAKRS